MRREKNMTHLQNFMEIPILQRKNIFCLCSKGGNLYRMLLFMFQDRNKKKKYEAASLLCPVGRPEKQTNKKPSFHYTQGQES